MLDEPLYGHYLKLTGAPRPYRDLVLDTMELDGEHLLSTAVSQVAICAGSHGGSVWACTRSPP